MEQTEETKPDLEAELMLQRKERTERAAKAIEEICTKEKVAIIVAGFVLNDGRLIPQIQITPL